MDNITMLQRTKGACFHNIYSQDQIKMLLDNKNCKCIDSNGSQVFLYNERAHVRAFWLIQDASEIPQLFQCAKEYLKGKTFISEVIYRDHQPEIIDTFLHSGFLDYRRLIFMVRKASPIQFMNHEIKVDKALDKDAYKIYELLWNYFDPYVSHLPNLNKISQSIANKEINVIRKDYAIVALTYFSCTGNRTKYLYQILTTPKCRGRGLASLLLADELINNNGQSTYSLWVEQNNQSAIEVYERYGFISGNRKLVVLKGE